MIGLTCSSCRKKLSVRDELAGKKVKCPGCGKAVAVPALAKSPVPSSSSFASESEDSQTLPSKEPPARARAEDQVTQPPASVSDDTNSPARGEPDHDSSLTDFLAPPQADDELGRLGGFRILKVLGHGGMGVVFLGEDPKLGRKVAIKAMLPHLAESKSSQQRFLREARAAASLHHDHIVPIFHVGEDRRAPFIVMPFLQGEPLDRRLQRDEKMPIPEVLRLGREIAKGLSAAHAAGLIHRDIKPANIWLEAPEDRVKVLDFGLARASAQESGLTQQGAIIGTPAYMAPEQGRGESLDARCDLWSLGVVLYRLCTGRLPFEGTDTVSTLMAVAMTNPEPPLPSNPEVPAGLSDLVMRLLEKDPGKRIASAQEVVDAIRALEKGDQATQLIVSEQVKVPPTKTKRQVPPITKAVQGSTGGAAPTKKSRKPLLVGICGAVVAAVALAIVLFWQTPHGLVRIESDDPNVEIVFDKTGPTIKGADKEPIRLQAGEHAVLIKRGDFAFEADKFMLRKGETITLKLELLKGKMQFVQVGKVIGEKALATAPQAKGSFALSFDGQTSYVHIPSLKLPEGPYTIEAWVTKRGKHTGVVMAVAGKSYASSLYLHPESSGFFVHTKDDIYRFQGALGGESDDRFFHLAGSWDGKVGRFFLSGKLMSTVSRLAPGDVHRGVPNIECMIGAQHNHIDPKETLALYAFHGLSAAVRVSKVARYTQDFVPHARFKPDADTLALYHFDEGQGDVLKDSSGNNHHGKIVGAKWVKVNGTVSNIPVAADPDRRAAEWALSMGGRISVKESGKQREIKTVDELPRGAFEVTFADFLNNPKVTDAGLAHFKDCKNLTDLHLVQTQVSDAGLVHFKDCKNLTALSLNHTKVSDAGLAHFKDCKDFTWLTLGSTEVGDAGLAHFKGCKNLTALSLNHTKVSDAGLVHFKECKNLTALRLDATQVSDAGLAHFKECKNLTLFHLSQTQVSDAGLAHVKDCKNLTALHLHDTQVSDAGLALIAGFPKLTFVGVIRTKVTEAGVKKLSAALPACRILWDGGDIQPRAAADPDRRAAEWVLSIGSTITIKEDGKEREIKAVGDLPRGAFELTAANLYRNPEVSDTGLAHFKDCKNLTLLNLDKTKVSDAGVAHFKDCKNLTLLSLWDTQVSDAGLAHFKDCKNLTLLGLNNTKVSDAGLAYFKDCKNLKRLFLGFTQVSDAGLADLASCPMLGYVNVKQTKVTAAGVKKLSAALPGCKIDWDGGVIEPRAAADPDRRAAEWVLSIGGTIGIKEGGSERKNPVYQSRHSSARSSCLPIPQAWTTSLKSSHRSSRIVVSMK